MRYLITADNHIDKKQYGVKQRTEDFKSSFAYIVNLAINRSLDIIAAGDIIDTKHPGPDAVSFLVEMHNLLVENSRRVFFISGNHEKHNDCEWLDAIKGKNLSVYGFINLDRVNGVLEYENYKLLGFAQTAISDLKQRINSIPDDKEIDVFVIHGALKELIGYGAVDAVSIEDFPSNIKCVIIGDTHKTKIFKSSKETLVISPGSTELIDKSEDTEKYVLEIDTDNLREEDIILHKLPTRQVIKRTIEQLSDVVPFKEELLQYKNKPLVFVDFKQEESLEAFRAVIKEHKDNYIIREGVNETEVKTTIKEAKDNIRLGKQYTINTAIESLSSSSENFKLLLKDLSGDDADVSSIIERYWNAIHTTDKT